MPRAGLRRDVLAAAAADIADESGYEQLTLAAVATRFGVRQPSLYKHVRSLAELRRDIAVLAGKELHAELSRATVGRSGTEALLAMADAYRRFALDHPGRYAATIALEPTSPEDPIALAAARLLEPFTAVLRGYDIAPADMTHALRALRSVFHGFASIEAGGGFQWSTDTDASFEWLIDLVDHGLTHGSRTGSAAPVSRRRS